MKLSGKSCSIPSRIVVLILLTSSSFFHYLVRVNISVAIIAMVPDRPSNVTTHIDDNPLSEIIFNTTDGSIGRNPEDLETFEWTSQQQSFVISAFSWGYAITSLVGGTLSEMWGPRKLVFTSLFVSGLLTLLSPQAAKIHYLALAVVRVLIGLLLGTQIPACQTLIARWAPTEEKGIFIASGLVTGTALGTIVMWNISGFLIGTFGWDYTFYIPGVIVLLGSILWWFIVHDSPHQHPRISEEERNYLSTAIGNKVQSKKKVSPPFRRILSSVPVYAFIVLHFGNLWGINFILTVSPRYISSVLGFSLASTGNLSSLPYVFRLIFSLIFGVLADTIIKKKWMTITFLRKFFCLFSHILPGILLLILGYISSYPILSMVVIITALSMNGAATITNIANGQDLAPNFAGTLFGIGNGIANFSGFIVPLVTGYFTRNGNSIEEWRPVLFTSTALYTGAAIIFLIFGTGETQWWNYIESTKNDKENEGETDAQKVV